MSENNVIGFPIDNIFQNIHVSNMNENDETNFLVMHSFVNESMSDILSILKENDYDITTQDFAREFDAGYRLMLSAIKKSIEKGQKVSVDNA